MGGFPLAEVIIPNLARPGNVLGAIWVSRNFRNPSWSCVPQFVSDLFLAEMETLGPENPNLSAKSSKSVGLCTILEPAAFSGTDFVAGATGVRGAFQGQGRGPSFCERVGENHTSKAHLFLTFPVDFL